MMNNVSEVSRRYAKALLALGKQKGSHHQLMSEMTAVAQGIAGDADLLSYFENPMIPSDQKVQVLKNGLTSKGLSEDTMSFLLLLADNQRVSKIAEIVQALQQATDAEEGLTRGVVRAARPLATDAQKELEQKISNTLGRKVVLTFQEDPKILGGLIAHVGGWTFDDSLETHLKKLNEELNRSAN